MGGPGDPPEGTPEGAPGGGDDEYRSVVFDESFVRAARLQEYSARERMADHAPAVRRRPPLYRGLSRQALILLLLIAVAFGTAIYLGVRHPYQPPKARSCACGACKSRPPTMGARSFIVAENGATKPTSITNSSCPRGRR